MTHMRYVWFNLYIALVVCDCLIFPFIFKSNGIKLFQMKFWFHLNISQTASRKVKKVFIYKKKNIFKPNSTTKNILKLRIRYVEFKTPTHNDI